MSDTITIIGGGLAGCEAAYQLLKRGYAVNLYEMRPKKATEIHRTELLAELVCSNSLKSTDMATSQGALKAELEIFDSLILKAAKRHSVPAGGALAVQREDFSLEVQKELSGFEKFTLINEEITSLPEELPCIVATGPLTSNDFAESLRAYLGEEELYFYDAVAPIVSFESIDMNCAFFGGRYGKGDDYINCPLTKDEYLTFTQELVKAEKAVLHDFEKGKVFEACLPVEALAARGEDTLRFGPMRPVGIFEPNTGKRPYAVVQLRKEDNHNGLYNLVGFQTNLKFGEQQRVFGLIPALKNAEFVRYGVIHRNTFINSPKLLNSDFSLRKNGNIFIAGQLCGVEGYMESAMAGLFSALSCDAKMRGKTFNPPSVITLSGSLIEYITAEKENFQPMHVSFALLPPLDENIKSKKDRKKAYADRAVAEMTEYAVKLNQVGKN